MEKYINDIDLSRFNNFLQGDSPASTFYYMDDLPSLESLFPEHVYYAILFKKNPGSEVGHWVCLIQISDTDFEYFDCLGGPLPQEIVDLFTGRHANVHHSKKPFMARDNYICGKWVMFRIMCLPNDLATFTAFVEKLTNRRKITPDSIVDFIINIPYGEKD